MQDLCLHSRRSRHCMYMFARSNVYVANRKGSLSIDFCTSYTSASRCRITEAEQSCMCCKEQNGGRNETALVQTRVIGRLNCDCVGRSCNVWRRVHKVLRLSLGLCGLHARMFPVRRTVRNRFELKRHTALNAACGAVAQAAASGRVYRHTGGVYIRPEMALPAVPAVQVPTAL